MARGKQNNNRGSNRGGNRGNGRGGFKGRGRGRGGGSGDSLEPDFSIYDWANSKVVFWYFSRLLKVLFIDAPHSAPGSGANTPKFQGRGRGGRGYSTPRGGHGTPNRGFNSPRGRGRPQYNTNYDDVDPGLGRGRGSPMDRGRGREARNLTSKLRAGAPLSKLLYEDRPLLRPIVFVRSVYTATLFEEEEDILQPLAEEVGKSPVTSYCRSRSNAYAQQTTKRAMYLLLPRLTAYSEQQTTTTTTTKSSWKKSTSQRLGGYKRKLMQLQRSRRRWRTMLRSP